MKIRKYLLLFVALALPFAFNACNQEDEAAALGGDVEITETLPGPDGTFAVDVRNVTVTSALRSITVSWEHPATTENLAFYRVEWQGNDADPALHSAIVASGVNSRVLTNLFNDDYTITVRCIATNFTSSQGATVTAAPVTDLMPPAQVAGMLVEPLASSATVTWRNPTEAKFLKSRIEVHDITNDESFDPVYLSALTTLYRITGLTDLTEYRVSITTIDYLGNESAPVVQETKTYTERLIDKSIWKLVGFSSEETSGEGANGRAAHALNDDDALFWHSRWTGGGTSLPQWIMFDLGQEVIPTVLISFRRNGNNNGPNLVRVEGSLDQETWNDFGTHTLLATVNTGQNCNLADPKMSKYIRYTVLGSGNGSHAMVRRIDMRALVSE